MMLLPMMLISPSVVRATEPAAAVKFVAFTFDDGPSSHTTTLLDGLRELDAKVTFFVNGVNGSMGAVNHSEKLTRMVKEGHQIANHTYSHHVPFDELDAASIRSQVEKVDTYLFNAAGDRFQSLVRTPGGATSTRIYQNVDAPIILWDVDTLDWKYRNEQTVYENIMNNVRDGSVVLLHDIHATSVAGALKAMKELKEQGYEMVTVSEMFRRRDIKLENGKAYRRAYNPGVDKGELKVPTITVDVSAVTGRSTVTITSPDPDMTYYSTTDGTEPTPASRRYNGTFETKAGVTVTAIAVDRYGTRTASSKMTVKQQFAGAFDAAYYRARYPDLASRYGTDDTALLNHFLLRGIYEDRQASPVFDIAYYQNAYPELKTQFGDDRVAYVLHFVHKGMSEGRRASAQFDPRSYRLRYADLRRSFGDDWNRYYMHYIRSGGAEGRTATDVTAMTEYETVYDGVDYAAVYDYNRYIEYHPEVWKSFGYDDAATLRFFVERGMALKHQASAEFSVTAYYNRYPDLRRAFKNDTTAYYRHYIERGKTEHRLAVGADRMQRFATVYRGIDYRAIYDYNDYLANYPEVAKQCGADEQAVLRHFVNVGIKRGYRAKNTLDPVAEKTAQRLYRRLQENGRLIETYRFLFCI